MSYATLDRKSETPPASKARTPAQNAAGGLRIGDSNDAFEQEANRVADQVMAGSQPKAGWSLAKMGITNPLQRTCAGGGSCECDECKKEKALQRKAVDSAKSGATAPPIVHEVLRSPGKPLDAASRLFMEPRFGRNFSQVRVHTDSMAARSAKAVHSRAYTVGSNIVFDSEQNLPGQPSGNYVLAHELAHVVQQNDISPARSTAVPPLGDASESRAIAADRSDFSGRQPPSPGGGKHRLQRLGANPGCNKTQAGDIHQAIYDANSWVAKTLAALAASPLAPRTLAALRHNFGASGTAANASVIAGNLKKGRAGMLNNPYSCAGAADATCSVASPPCGYTPAAGVHSAVICANPTLTGRDVVYRAGCMLHEAMHASDASMTGDIYSGWFKHSGFTAGYPGGDPMTNADSYTTLAIELS